MAFLHKEYDQDISQNLVTSSIGQALKAKKISLLVLLVVEFISVGDNSQTDIHTDDNTQKYKFICRDNKYVKVTN